MTRTQFSGVLRGLVGLPLGHPRITNDDQATFFDEAALFLAEELVPARLLGIGTVALVDGTALYEVPGALRVNSAMLNGEPVVKATFEQMEVSLPTWSDAEGVPKFFCEEGSAIDGSAQIRLFPTPAANATLTIGLLRAPQKFLDYDEDEELSEWRGYAQTVIAFYAAWRFLMNGFEFASEERMNRMQMAWERGLASLRGYDVPEATQAQQDAAKAAWRRQ